MSFHSIKHLALCSILVTVTTLVSGAHLPPQSVLRIGSAEIGSGMYNHATALATAFDATGEGHHEADHDHSFGVAVASAGPIANLKDLLAGRIEFGLATADLAESVVKKPEQYGLDASISRLRLVSSLPPAVLHIVGPKQENMNLEKLAGKRISVGMPDAGVLLTIEQLLEEHGLTKSQLDVYHYPLSIAATKLTEGELDAIMIMDQVPNAVIGQLLGSNDFALYQINAAALDEITGSNPVYRTSQLNGYSGGTDGPVSLAVDTFLLSQDTVPPQSVRPLVDRLLGQHSDAETSKHIKLRLKQSNIPLHDACETVLSAVLTNPLIPAAAAAMPETPSTEPTR